MDDRVLPSNVGDPRFTRADTDLDRGWSAPDFGVQWPEVIYALLESLPVVLERLGR